MKQLCWSYDSQLVLRAIHCVKYKEVFVDNTAH